MYQRLTDDELLGTDDPAAFTEFYRRHVDAVIGYFMRRTRDPDAAADLTAETFAAALLARRRFRPGGPPAGAWLFGIAHNKLTDWLRRGQAENRARRRLGLERIELSEDDRYEIEELADEVSLVDLVDELPAEQREALRGRFFQQRGYEDIAKQLDVSEAVVRKRVSRGIAGLRRRLEGEKE